MRRRLDHWLHRTAVAFVCALAPAAVPAQAAAEENAEPIRLVYRAPATCPDEVDFIARVRARTARLRPAWPGEPARAFTVVVDAGPPPSGRVRIGALEGAFDGQERARSVRADTCSDAVDALALVVALAVDPRASAPPFAAASSGPSHAAASPAAPAAPVWRDPPHESQPVQAAAAARAEEATGRRAVEPSDGAAFYAGGDFVVATGVAPNPILGGSPYAGWRAKRAGWLDPSIRVAFLRAGSGTFDVPTGGRASFVLTVGRADVCPVGWPGGSLRIAGCARVEAGALEGTGADITASTTKLRPWLAAGPLVRAEWPAAAPLSIDAEASVLFRLVDDRFVFLPDVTVYEVPTVGVGAGIGLGLRFF